MRRSTKPILAATFRCIFFPFSSNVTQTHAQDCGKSQVAKDISVLPYISRQGDKVCHRIRTYLVFLLSLYMFPVELKIVELNWTRIQIFCCHFNYKSPCYECCLDKLCLKVLKLFKGLYTISIGQTDRQTDRHDKRHAIISQCLGIQILECKTWSQCAVVWPSPRTTVLVCLIKMYHSYY